MNNIKVLIPAAGKGTRANLPYPKTLYEVDGKPILLHIFELIEHIDSCPTIVASLEGKNHIENFLKEKNLNAHIVIQQEAKGMGNAVLAFDESPSSFNAKDLILIWGDIPFIQKQTLIEMIRTHNINNNTFTFVTKLVESAYTIVIRDSKGEIIEVSETREEEIKPSKGERDIGLFIFKKGTVFSLLKKELSGKYGLRSGEHGFLYIIKHLINQRFKVQGLPIASVKELISLNKISDLSKIDKDFF